eukprot:m.24328 g.24328  ORF g.24328 m.24328 type:complete len:953 (+) comp7598_c0_seq2:261-3119(+)
MLRRLGSIVRSRHHHHHDRLIQDGVDNQRTNNGDGRGTRSDADQAPLVVHNVGPAEELTKSQVIHHLLDAMIHDQARTLVHTLQLSHLSAEFTVGQNVRPLLHVAASLGALECARELLRLGGDVDRQDANGTTATHLAARNGHPKLLHLLVVEHNANIRIVDSDGFTAVHWLANNGRAALLASLLEMGQPVDLQDKMGQTALHVASHAGHAACVSFLLQCGASVCALDRRGRNALFYACKNGSVETIAVLLAHNAVVIKDEEGVDALDMCLRHAFPQAASRLLLHDPALVLRVVRAAAEDQFEEEIVRRVLVEYALTSVAASRVALMSVAELAATTGQKLLCPSSEHNGTSFERVCGILVSMIKALKSSELAKSPVQSWMTTPSREQVISRLCRTALETLRTAWAALEEWLLLFAEELAPPKASTGDTRRRSVSQARRLSQIIRNISSYVGDVQCYARVCAGPGVCYVPSCRNRVAIMKAPENDMFMLCGDRVQTAISAFALVTQSVDEMKGRGNDRAVSPKLFEFVSRHAQVFRHLIAMDATTIFSKFSFLLTHPCLFRMFADVVRKQPFEQRQEWFHDQLEKLVDTSHTRTLTVNRKELFNSSCRAFAALKEVEGGLATALKQNIAVEFEGEPGMGEGVKREWVSLLSQELLNPNYGLFTTSSDGTTFQPSPNSYVNPDHLQYFEFAGHAVGMALLHRQLLGVVFSRVFYKYICGKPADYNDAAVLDPEYAQSLKWILDNDITDSGLDLTFSTTSEHFGQEIQTELIPNGANIAVTEENKQGFVHLLASQKLTGAVRNQMNSFLRGFHTVVPRYLVGIFDECELELLLSGVPEIDVEDWRLHTQYTGFKEDSETIKMFWNVLRDLSQPERALVLKFVTGATRVPPGGFANLRGGNGNIQFTISEDSIEDRLPSASTCFNLLKLPNYESEARLKKQLMTAVCHGGEGFEFA